MCGRLDGKIFDVKDMKNYPLIHPYCRCTTIPYREDLPDINSRWSKNPITGKSEIIGNMSYNDWVKRVNALTKESSTVNGERVGTNKVDMRYIHSKAFKDKFQKISDNRKLNDLLYKKAVAMLTHRQGTDGEDTYILDEKGNTLNVAYSNGNEPEVAVSAERVSELIKDHGRGTMIGMHNHPTNVMPTGSDYTAAGYRGYKFGIVVTHSGEVYKYTPPKSPISRNLFDYTVKKYYNLGVLESYQKATDYLRKLGATCEKL